MVNIRSELKRIFAMALTMALLFTSVGLESFAAEKEEFIKTQVNYSEDKKTADILFDIDSVKENYEVQSISVEDDSVSADIYNIEDVSEDTRNPCDCR